MLTTAERVRNMTQVETISFLIGTLDGQRYLIAKQQAQINTLLRDVSEVVALRMDLGALKVEFAEFRTRVTTAVPSTGSNPNLCFCGKSKPSDRDCCADCYHHNELADLETSKWLGS